MLAGSRRHSNTMYKLFLIVTSPVMKIVRKISPPQVIDRHCPLSPSRAVLVLDRPGLAEALYCDTNLLQCF
jgi:hypothetical protein